MIESVQRLLPPDHAVEDRDRRKALTPRTLTARFCGDPLPGYSALDRYNHDLLDNSMRMKASASMEAEQ